MNARIASYVPRFALAIAAVPLAFVMVAFAAARFGAEPAPLSAGAGAVTFAAVVLAPSTVNAAVRAGIACGLAALGCAAAFAFT